MGNAYALIPLIAAIALFGPLIALLIQRPVTRRNILFLSFVFPAVLWSLSDFVLRSGLIAHSPVALVKFIICLAVLMTVQFHYLLRSFAGKLDPKALVAYLPLAAVAGCAVSGLVPESVDVGSDDVVVSYGPWMLPIVIVLAGFIIHDAYLLFEKRKKSDRLVERNQIAYLLLATSVDGLLIAAGFTPMGTAYATSHVGNLAAALILAYAIVICDLADIGVAVRRALAVFCTIAVATAFYVLALWVSSLVLGFELQPDLILAAAAATTVGITFLYYIRTFSQRLLDGILLGKRLVQREELARLVSTESIVVDPDDFAHQLLALLAGSIGSRRAWILLPVSANEGLRVRWSYSEDSTDPASCFDLAHDDGVLTWLRRESRPLSGRELSAVIRSNQFAGSEKRSLLSTTVGMLIPAVCRGELAFVVAIGTKEGGGIYSLEEEELAKNAVIGIGSRLEYAITQERTQIDQENAAVVNHLTTILSSGGEFQSAFDRFVKELNAVVANEVVGIALADGDSFYLWALWANSPVRWQVEQRIPMSGTGIERSLKQQRSLLEPDLSESSLFSSGQQYLKKGVRCVLYVPLISEGKGLGTMILGSRQPKAYGRTDIEFLENLGAAMTLPIVNLRLYLSTEERARMDELTQLFNRRYFEERLSGELIQQSRNSRSFSLLMIDLDSFKMFNDVFGHRAGDDVLKRAARLIASSIRANDQAFRYGGDEFAVILPETDISVSYQVALRVRQTIVQDAELASSGITASIGVAGCPVNGLSADDLVTAADTALYNSKYMGGNRCSVVTDIPPASAPREAAGKRRRPPNLAAINALMAVVEARDHSNYGHSQSVRTFAVMLGKALNLPDDVVSRLSVASLLHDVGKIGTTESPKAAKEAIGPSVTDEPWMHARLGATIVSGVPSLAECAAAIRYHHERYDGDGNPEALAGDAIPLEARILAIANAFANLVSGHVPHASFSQEEALVELQKHSGSSLDPTLVRVFVHANADARFNMDSTVNETLDKQSAVGLARQVNPGGG